LTPTVPVDAAVIGGGPAGAAVGRLLASWGHSVRILDKGADRSRGLAESLPPSTTKLLAQIGVLDAVRRAGFYRTNGNTVWWASRERRIERFAPGRDALGYQVFRPELDRVLLDEAEAAGAQVERGAQVRRVSLSDDLPRVAYETAAGPAEIAARFTIDCSGRSGILGRRFRVPHDALRTWALVGVWDAADWDVPDPTHTLVETMSDGWAWSVPISPATRHVGIMIGPALPDDRRVHDLQSLYTMAIAGAPHISALVGAASLQRVWACDASVYSARRYAGDQFLLVGDAGSFIDPLSSFGVKKALASAWVAAVAVHTALTYPDRRQIALSFFDDWERRVFDGHRRRSRDFARQALSDSGPAFWSARAETAADEPLAPDPDEPALHDSAVLAAFERFKASDTCDLVIADTARFESRPVIRGREIVVEQALAGGMRFVANVDLVRLAHIAPTCRRVPDVFEAYCRSCPPAPLPNVLGGLSLLVARGVLHERS
jgi:flavin-dependent dehydrogenase